MDFILGRSPEPAFGDHASAVSRSMRAALQLRRTA
jgi:hypothetical protein